MEQYEKRKCEETQNNDLLVFLQVHILVFDNTLEKFSEHCHCLL